jgi:branched-chain amino acid transport system substrate-binding protein
VDPNIQLMGVSNAYTQQIIQLGGSAVEGLIAPVSFFAGSADPGTKEFVDEFRKRFGMEPSALAAQAYDSMGIFFEAIKAAGSLDRAKVRDAVNNIKYPGVTGMTTFDKQGDADKIFQKVIIQGGKFVQYKK